MARILLVDDEEPVVSLVRHTLRKEGHEVFTAFHGLEALATARRHTPDLVILDIVMPGMDGLAVCQRLRQDPRLAAIPILFLTGRDAVEERIEGLDAGGDDYLPKPFESGELSARVRALLRRVQVTQEPDSQPEDAACLTVGSLSLDLHSRRVRVKGKTVEVTPTELALLHHLMAHPGEVFSTEELLQEVWGYSPGTGETSLVRWHVRNLRAKIEKDPACPRFIKTVSRHGYALTEDS